MERKSFGACTFALQAIGAGAFDILSFVVTTLAGTIFFQLRLCSRAPVVSPQRAPDRAWAVQAVAAAFSREKTRPWETSMLTDGWERPPVNPSTKAPVCKAMLLGHVACTRDT